MGADGARDERQGVLLGDEPQGGGVRALPAQLDILRNVLGGVGGAVGTVTQSRAAVPKVTPENFGQFITGRNVAKNNATVDEASCYYWDGNN